MEFNMDSCGSWFETTCMCTLSTIICFTCHAWRNWVEAYRIPGGARDREKEERQKYWFPATFPLNRSCGDCGPVCCWCSWRCEWQMMDELGCGGGRWMIPADEGDGGSLDPYLGEGAWCWDGEIWLVKCSMHRFAKSCSRPRIYLWMWNWTCGESLSHFQSEGLSGVNWTWHHAHCSFRSC